MRILLTTLVFGLLTPAAAFAQTEVGAAPDITVDLSGVTVSDDEVAIDDLMGGIAIQGFSVPASAEVDAYHEEGGGAVLFSLDTSVDLPGSVFARPEDVVRLDGGSYSLELDASTEGIPDGANLDAVTRNAAGDLVVSFDTTLSVDGVVAQDEDLLRFDGTSFSLELDGSGEGFDSALDLDAVQFMSGTTYAVSFDGHGSNSGVDFADEDVVEVDSAGSTVTLLYDASAEHAGWSPADLGALSLPEPTVLVSLAAGGLLLSALARRRR